MKVLLVSPSLSPRGGGVAQVVALTDALLRTRAGIETEILAVAEREDPDDLIASVAPRARVYRYFGSERYKFAPGLVLGLLRSKADVVHVHGLWTFHAAAVHLLSLLTGRPYVVTPHGMLDPWIMSRSRRLKGVISTLYQNAFLRRARRVQALTASEAGDIRALVPAARVAIVPNYVASPDAGGAKPAWWREGFDERQVFLFLGRIHTKKGCVELLEAWERLCARDAQFAAGAVLVFCGWIDDLSDFEARVDALAGRFGNVLFAGPQFGPAKADSFAAATWYVLPSHSEGLPMTVIEAWSAGTPALISTACNLPAGIESGAALPARPDAELLAGDLSSAFRLPAEERARMGANAAELARSTFSPEAVAGPLEAMYKQDAQ
jgi:glycosyltransferase involved in cell wall biosynthesis